MKFYDREQEKAILEQAERQTRSAMIVISGRRRVGKSRLVHEFLKGKKAVKLFIVPKQEKQVAQDFADALAEGYHPTFESIQSALEYFFTESKKRIMFIDEFPNFLDVNPAIPHELQRLWDEYRNQTNKILVLSGSYTGMMDRVFTRKKAPLFNRATHKILLEPLAPRVIWAMQRDIGISDATALIKNHCLLGGIPYYYEIMERNPPAQTQPEELFFGIGQLREEGQDVLRQEFGSAYKKHFAILEAIGAGHVSAGHIADQLGIRQTTLSKYLAALQDDFKIVERHVPFGQNPRRSKKGIYAIKDNLLAFWFTHVFGKTTPPNPNDVNAFVGKRFEKLCATFLKTRLEENGETIIRQGRWWGPIEIRNKTFEQRDIDVILETNQAVYAGECKWTNTAVGRKELERLKQTAQSLPTKKPLKFVLFTKKPVKEKNENALYFNAKHITQQAKP